MMQLEDFIQSIKEETSPEGLSEPLQAMWHARKGNWEIGIKPTILPSPLVPS